MSAAVGHNWWLACIGDERNALVDFKNASLARSGKAEPIQQSFYETLVAPMTKGRFAAQLAVLTDWFETTKDTRGCLSSSFTPGRGRLDGLMPASHREQEIWKSSPHRPMAKTPLC